MNRRMSVAALHGVQNSARAPRGLRKVLVVEDTAICREPLVSALKLHGFEAIGAADGQKALDLIATTAPDLILLDIAMPQMDGWTMLSKLRDDPKHARTPVILLTATADAEWVARARQLGVREYLLKTDFSITDMFARVQKCLGMRPEKSPAQQTPAAPAPRTPSTK